LGATPDSTHNSAPPPTPTVNPLPTELDSDILINDDNILDTVIPDLMPDTGELELLMREVEYK
jgi:hypothetical protein